MYSFVKTKNCKYSIHKNSKYTTPICLHYLHVFYNINVVGFNKQIHWFKIHGMDNFNTLLEFTIL
jgi:hypothetical protein